MIKIKEIKSVEDVVKYFEEKKEIEEREEFYIILNDKRFKNERIV